MKTTRRTFLRVLSAGAATAFAGLPPAQAIAGVASSAAGADAEFFVFIIALDSRLLSLYKQDHAIAEDKTAVDDGLTVALQRPIAATTSRREKISSSRKPWKKEKEIVSYRKYNSQRTRRSPASPGRESADKQSTCQILTAKDLASTR